METGSTWTTSSSEHNLEPGLKVRPGNYDSRVEHFKFAKDELIGHTYVTFADSNLTKIFHKALTKDGNSKNGG